MVANLDIKKFSINDIPNLGNNITSHVFKPGQTIFYKEHFPYGLFILLEGKVEIFYKKEIKNIEETVFLGIHSFLNNQAYKTTAIAKTLCIVNFLSLSLYQELMRENHPIISFINY